MLSEIIRKVVVLSCILESWASKATFDLNYWYCHQPPAEERVSMRTPKSKIAGIFYKSIYIFSSNCCNRYLLRTIIYENINPPIVRW